MRFEIAHPGLFTYSNRDEAGELMPRNKTTVTSHDVARLAGVSQASVSRAFTPGSSLSPEKREKILKAADQLDYIPNSIASSLNTARTNTVALVIGDIDNPFYVRVQRAFMTALQNRGYQTLTFTVEPEASPDEAIRRVLRFRVDGIILTAAQLSTRTASLCEDRGIPLVLFNRYIPGLELPVVRCDNFGGGKLMGQTLYAAGARTFSVLKGDPLGTTSKDRVEGFQMSLLEQGIRSEAIETLEAGSTYDGAFAAMEARYPSAEDLPDAIFGVNDIMAMAACDWIRHRLGKAIPADVLVAGFDNIPEGGRIAYGLTTLGQPIDAMVTEALELLDDELNEEPHSSKPDQRIVASSLVWRDTVPRP